MSAADVLSQLLEASWRGIGVPTVMVGADGSHNIVLHKRVDRNGARVENTGRNSGVYTFKVPFVNTITPGPLETWAQPLFPGVYVRFLTALEDRSTGPFVHPIHGQRKCKAADWKEVLDPDFRGGVVLQVQLIETVDDGDAVAIADTAVLSVAAAAAFTLDAGIATLHPPPDTGLPAGMTIVGFIKSLGAIADQVDLARQQILGKIDALINALSVLKQKFIGDGGFSDATERLISALHAYKAEGLRADKATSVYIVPALSSLPAVARKLKNDVGDMLKLNPGLAASPFIPAQTPVVYYA